MKLLDINAIEPVIDTPRPTQIETASLITIQAFQGKVRYGGLCPMAFHSLRVGSTLERLPGSSSQLVVAGLGHDWYEDTSITHPDVERIFGSETANLIRACSYPDPALDGTREGNLILLDQATAWGADAIAIKIADIADNLATILQIPKEKDQEEMLWCATEWLNLCLFLPSQYKVPLTIPLQEAYLKAI